MSEWRWNTGCRDSGMYGGMRVLVRIRVLFFWVGRQSPHIKLPFDLNCWAIFQGAYYTRLLRIIWILYSCCSSTEIKASLLQLFCTRLKNFQHLSFVTRMFGPRCRCSSFFSVPFFVNLVPSWIFLRTLTWNHPLFIRIRIHLEMEIPSHFVSPPSRQSRSVTSDDDV